MNIDSRTGKPAEPGNAIPGYEAIRDALQVQAIGARQVLPVHDCLLAILASLCLESRKAAMIEKVGLALEAGLEPRAVSELVLQTGLYGGLPLVEEMGELLGKVFMGKGVKPSLELLPPEDREQLLVAASEYQRLLHGERQQWGHADPMDEHTAELYGITSQYGYGLVWRRPGLDMRQRLIVALSCFVTIGYVDNFLLKFTRSAMTHGFTVEEVREVVVQVSPYIGFPRALRALTVMKGAFEDPEAAPGD